jgi:thiol:disulfide interchange protein DsbD
MKKLFSTLLLALIAIMANAQVTWSYKLVDDNTENPKIQMTATIADGFHLYAVENPAGGSNPLEFYFDVKGAQLVGKPVANKAYTKEFDDTFEVDQYYYANSVTFTQKLKATAAEYSVNVEIKGQACDDQGCHQIFGSKKFTGKAPVKGEVEEVEATVSVAVSSVFSSLASSFTGDLPVSFLLPKIW